jgi:ubiquinone/menaquinone biosynthesis C-methylase UbiE
VTDSKVIGNKPVESDSFIPAMANYQAYLRADVTSAESPGLKAVSTLLGRLRPVALRRTSVWDRRSQTGLDKVTAAVLAAASVRPGDRVLDIGCGTGQLSLALADQGAEVLAVDASQLMIDRLVASAEPRALIAVETLMTPIERLSLPTESVDLIVSSYALHYLRDVDKARLIAAAYYWLRPGGTMVVADMMFGRGVTEHDRAIIRSKVRSLAKKGIGGWWRIAKNSYRYLVRAQERPVSISTWATMLARAGFKGITASSILNEAGMVTGHRDVADHPYHGMPSLPRPA